MRRLLVPAVTAAILATSAAAFAATMHNATGTVKSIDSKMLTLANGAEYMLPKGFKDPGLKAGRKVTVAWDMKGKNRMVEKVTIAK